jgi:hypothetical protein
MNTHNEAFQNSLRCLGHPLSLLSIVVLLLNDHIFKIISPSWLTGKLSDFSGLFFFPFIVAAALSILLSKCNLTLRTIGQLAFGFVTIWFTLLKISLDINFLTSQLSSFVIGFPTQFILDWTDIIGLIVMVPAWNLWKQSTNKPPHKLAFTALLVATLASLATSPNEIFESVTDVVFKDEIVYGVEAHTKGYEDYPAAWSKDGGLSWNHYGSVLNNIITSINEKTLPVQVCSESNYELCYKVTDEHYLFESKDKGETWEIVSAKKYRFTYAYDVIIFTLNGHEYVLVAIGESGVLRRELPSGNWRKISVLDANK